MKTITSIFKMPKEVNQVDGMTIISFKNELGQLHRERGRPARIAHRNDGISCFFLMAHYLGQEKRAEINQILLLLVIILVNMFILSQIQNAPHLVNLYPDGSYDIYYANLFIYGNNEFKYVENIDGHFIIGYNLNYGGTSAFILDNTRQRINVPPERAKILIFRARL
jgi:hypothetical protein